MKTWKRLSLLALIGSVLGFAFTNCGRIAPEGMMTSSSYGRDICSSRLKTAYEGTYFPFLSTNCNSCHSSAHGSTDLNTSFNAFLSKSVAVIDYKAITAHGGNTFSASTMQPKIDAFKPAYTAAYAEYSSCKARLANGDYFDLALDYAAVPTLVKPTNNNAQWKEVVWDTETQSLTPEMGAKFKATVKIDIRAYVYQDNIVGVQFRNPRVTLKAGQAAMSIQGIKVSMNGASLDSVTAYSTLNVNMEGTTEIQLAAGLGSPSAVLNVSGTNTLALDLIGLSSNLNEVDEVTPPPIIDGGDLSNLPASITFAELSNANSQYGIFAKNCNSCHSPGRLSGGLDLTNYNVASLNAANVLIRMTDGNRPMPQSGILDERSRQIVNIWVTGGTPR